MQVLFVFHPIFDVGLDGLWASFIDYPINQINMKFLLQSIKLIGLSDGIFLKF